MSMLFDVDLKEPTPLPEQDSWPESKHRFDEESIWAIRAALAAQRPLLLRGEPGIGKSQLARAAAAVLGSPFLYHVIDERSERDDLFFSYDAVARLGQAQVSALEKEGDWRQRLAERNFIRPGVLWWAFDWQGAGDQAQRFSENCRPCPAPVSPTAWEKAPLAQRNGPVVLIDEIDKADPSLPNGLLESLGNKGFLSAQLGEAVRLPHDARPPLVMITTNEERELPPAFMRRCLVHYMRFPANKDEAAKFLRTRARVFWSAGEISDAICNAAAQMLWRDRGEARRHGLAIPGAAEYLDILRVLVKLAPGDKTEQDKLLQRIAPYALRKDLGANVSGDDDGVVV